MTTVQGELGRVAHSAEMAVQQLQRLKERAAALAMQPDVSGRPPLSARAAAGLVRKAADAASDVVAELHDVARRLSVLADREA